MKKIVYLLLSIFVVSACSIVKNYPVDNYYKLQTGMTKKEVRYWIGPPERYLDKRRTPYGYEEILQYRNIYGELFAMNFINNQLMAVDYISKEADYPIYPTPPPPSPPHGTPIFSPDNKPVHPAPPSNTPPSQGTRPPSSSREPAITRPPSNPRQPAVTNDNRSKEGSSKENTRENAQSKTQSNARESSRSNAKENTPATAPEKSRNASSEQNTETTRERSSQRR
ncbi:MAG: hypothetical protein LBG15_08745 [Dysgonamonadaceae bacterium]|jgi:hypothetical protein|nr:hypothetical protein [Dysgonamonadaceae bacterium]